MSASAHTHTHMRQSVRVACTHVHIHTLVHGYTHTYIHTVTHMQSCDWPLLCDLTQTHRHAQQQQQHILINTHVHTQSETAWKTCDRQVFHAVSDCVCTTFSYSLLTLVTTLQHFLALTEQKSAGTDRLILIIYLKGRFLSSFFKNIFLVLLVKKKKNNEKSLKLVKIWPWTLTFCVQRSASVMSKTRLECVA